MGNRSKQRFLNKQRKNIHKIITHIFEFLVRKYLVRMSKRSDRHLGEDNSKNKKE